LDSFLHPLVAELNVLAKGIPGVRVFGSPNPVTMRANVLQITGDIVGKVYHCTWAY